MGQWLKWEWDVVASGNQTWLTQQFFSYTSMIFPFPCQFKMGTLQLGMLECYRLFIGWWLEHVRTIRDQIRSHIPNNMFEMMGWNHSSPCAISTRLCKLQWPHFDLTGIMVNKGNHPQMALIQARLVNNYNLPRYMNTWTPSSYVILCVLWSHRLLRIFPPNGMLLWWFGTKDHVPFKRPYVFNPCPSWSIHASNR